MATNAARPTLDQWLDAYAPCALPLRVTVGRYRTNDGRHDWYLFDSGELTAQLWTPLSSVALGLN